MRGDFGGGVLKYQAKNFVFVYINSTRTPRELLENLEAVEREVFSVLIHETTHLRDLLTHKPEGYRDDALVYHNEPAEVRAFMQQIADEVLEHLGGAEPTGASMREALKASATWRRVADSLTPANRRLVLRGVSTAVLDAVGGR